MNDLENEYVVGTYGTAYKAIDVFRTGEAQGTHNERLRIIKLLEEQFEAWYALKNPNPYDVGRTDSLAMAIQLIKGEK